MAEKERETPAPVKMFVAEESLEQLRLLQTFAQHLPEVDVTGTFLEGEALLRALESGRTPHIVVLNLVLRDMDAIELLERMQGMSLAMRPCVLVTSGARNGNIHDRLLALGVDHCLMKPYRMQNLFDRAKLLCSKGSGRETWLNWLIENRLEQYSIGWGEGYWYMIRALHKVVTAAPLVRMVEDVYNAVAHEEGVSMGAVESSLRRTLGEAKEAATPEFQRLEQIQQSKGKKMTVGAFLNMVGQIVKKDYEGREE